jgi:steroid delta-isomerase-like uncharacterized protein
MILENAKKYMRIWNAGQSDLLNKYASEDITVNYSHFSKEIRGISDYEEMLKMTYGYFPDLQIAINKTYAHDKAITLHWTYEGTFKNGELFGIKAGNQKVTVSGITILEFDKNELVVKDQGIVDNLSLAMQIGAL